MRKKMVKMDKLVLSPIKINNIELKNRIIFAPTSLGLSHEETVEKYRSIARGGVAMIIVGDVPVSKRGFLSMYNRKMAKHYQDIIDAIHSEGALACAQLHSSDSKFTSLIKYIPLVLIKKMTPNDLRNKLNESVPHYISTLPLKKVKEIISNFGDAAEKATQLGFDCVQVHGDRICGSFSSSIMNFREDEYGGSPENRAKFAVACVSAIRKKCPNITIDYKLAVRQEKPHYGNAGVIEEEIKVFVPLLEKAGVNSFHVALANHGELEDTIPPVNHPYFKEQGCFLKFADEVKKYTNLPICGVGCLEKPEFIEEQLQNHRIEMAAMSRQLIADSQWVNKVKNNEETSIHTCVRCNQKCLKGMQAHKGVHCIYEGRAS
ncbi:bilirubin reductase [Anaerorhabdus sp.]|uniref:bilirubin reductase n=1 Tax=Anaerorhabdus sp. TaxID=1872524 RepID=UPI002FC7A65A